MRPMFRAALAAAIPALLVAGCGGGSGGSSKPGRGDKPATEWTSTFCTDAQT